MEYTVKEIADLLQVSKTTVQKSIKANNIDYDYISKNKQYYSYEKTKKIIESIRKDFDFLKLENSQTKLENQLENSQTETENLKTKIENSETKTENQLENSKTDIDTVNRMLDMLQQEIEKKDKTIQDLQDKLDKAYTQITDLATKAQYITAADKTAQIMDKQQQKETIINAAAANNEAEPQPKKSLWQRLFNK